MTEDEIKKKKNKVLYIRVTDCVGMVGKIIIGWIMYLVM